MEVGDKVEIKHPGVYRDQALGMGHQGVVKGQRQLGRGATWWFVLFDGQEEAISVMEHEVEVLGRRHETTNGTSPR